MTEEQIEGLHLAAMQVCVVLAVFLFTSWLDWAVFG